MAHMASHRWQLNVCLSALTIFPVWARAGEGEELLRRSDAKLIPDTCTYRLALTTMTAGGETKSYDFVGFKKGANRNVLIVNGPAKIAGSVHLRKGDDVWTYFTTNRRVSKVAYQAVFLGTLLNYGDILASELSVDNEVTAVERTATEIVLTLRPKANHGGYAKVVVTLGKDSLLPMRRSYYALSGALVKECVFADIDTSKGTVAGMTMKFFEPVSGQRTSVKIWEVQILPSVPDAYFDENQIKSLWTE